MVSGLFLRTKIASLFKTNLGFLTTEGKGRGKYPTTYFLIHSSRREIGCILVTFTLYSYGNIWYNVGIK